MEKEEGRIIRQHLFDNSFCIDHVRGPLSMKFNQDWICKPVNSKVDDLLTVSKSNTRNGRGEAGICPTQSGIKVECLRRGDEISKF